MPHINKIVLFRHQAWIGVAHLTNLLSEFDIAHGFININADDTIPKHIEADIAGLGLFG